MGNTRLIWLVDDDKISCFVGKKIMMKTGFAGEDEIEWFHSGRDALETLLTRTKDDQDNLPEVIFLDVNLQNMTGWEFIEEYEKYLADHKNKPVVIMLSSSIYPDDRKRAQKMDSVKAYMLKPLTEEKIREIESNLLSQWENE